MLLTASPQTALLVNTAVSSFNGLVYLIAPLRENAAKALFGVSSEEQSALAGAFQTIGGLHAALASMCIATCLGRRSARETLCTMVMVHAFQCAVGFYRALAAWLSDKLSQDEPKWWSFLGAGGGPGTMALLLGLITLSGLSAS